MDKTNILLITSNVGSLFEGPAMADIQSTWFTEVLKVVETYQPAFLAIHCQEVGGKKSENNKELVHKFVRDLFRKEELQQYVTCLGYLDENYKAQDQYTALGSFYFIRKNTNLEQWNFQTCQFNPVSTEKEIFQIVNDVPTIQKQKFPHNHFPEGRWSRKGFMLTRWRLSGRIIDLVNIHLMNDICNIKAIEASPSKYTHFRKDSLRYTLDKLNNNESDHSIIFGDFNTRLDTKLFVENYMKALDPLIVHNDGETIPRSVVYKSIDDHEQDLLLVCARKFNLHNWEYFTEKNIAELLQLDTELTWCSDELKELDILFLPSYPHSEDPTTNAVYSNTRCPAWCDRILFDAQTHKELKESFYPTLYNCIGKDVCIGDHKPVFLSFSFPDLPPSNSSTNENTI